MMITSEGVVSWHRKVNSSLLQKNV